VGTVLQEVNERATTLRTSGHDGLASEADRVVEGVLGEEETLVVVRRSAAGKGSLVGDGRVGASRLRVVHGDRNRHIIAREVIHLIHLGKEDAGASGEVKGNAIGKKALKYVCSIAKGGGHGNTCICPKSWGESSSGFPERQGFGDWCSSRSRSGTYLRAYRNECAGMRGIVKPITTGSRVFDLHRVHPDLHPHIQIYPLSYRPLKDSLRTLPRVIWPSEKRVRVASPNVGGVLHPTPTINGIDPIVIEKGIRVIHLESNKRNGNRRSERLYKCFQRYDELAVIGEYRCGNNSSGSNGRIRLD